MQGFVTNGVINGKSVTNGAYDTNARFSLGMNILVAESLMSIVIPDSVTKIGGGAFSCCTGLKVINVPRSPYE